MTSIARGESEESNILLSPFGIAELLTITLKAKGSSSISTAIGNESGLTKFEDKSSTFKECISAAFVDKESCNCQ
jgi:serine protease inhibitor